LSLDGKYLLVLSGTTYPFVSCAIKVKSIARANESNNDRVVVRGPHDTSAVAALGTAARYMSHCQTVFAQQDCPVQTGIAIVAVATVIVVVRESWWLVVDVDSSISRATTASIGGSQ
jgi:hypothetical protein